MDRTLVVFVVLGMFGAFAFGVGAGIGIAENRHQPPARCVSPEDFKP